MEDFYIDALRWTQVSSLIYEANPVLHNILEPIVEKLRAENKDYFYRLRFKFGEPVIDKGRMVAMLKNPTINIGSSSGLNPISREQFVADCGLDSDHPLSLVLENYIELFHKQKSSYGNISEYNFPLDIISKGELLGVFGAINNFKKMPSILLNPWDAVAGKACIVPLFPRPDFGTSSSLYKNFFFEIFQTEKIEPVDAIYSKFNSLFGNTWKTDILTIPTFYYNIDSNKDDEEAKNQKMRFQNYLFGIGWEQSQKFREWHWQDKIIKKEILKNDIIHEAALLATHIVRITQNKTYCLKMVDSRDKELFETFKSLLCEFKKERKVTKNVNREILSEYFPGFLHYEKFSNIDLNAIELLHSPSVNLNLASLTMEQLRKNVMYDLFKNHNQLINYINKNGNKITISYFFKADVDHFSKKAFTVKEFIDTILSEQYKTEMDGRKIILTKIPTVLNGFVLLRKN